MIVKALKVINNVLSHSIRQRGLSFTTVTKPKFHFDMEMNRIVWIDLEMTGLDIINDRIMEIACVVSDESLNIIAEAPRIVIHQPPSLLDNMNEWCRKQHGKSGLTQECKESSITQEKAEDLILEFLKQHVTDKASPLAGNSVYMDRMFLKMYMPKLNDFIHYRIIDVSSIKELCRRWNTGIYKKAPAKQFSHRALDDIKESLDELKYYKENFFKTGFP